MCHGNHPGNPEDPGPLVCWVNVPQPNMDLMANCVCLLGNCVCPKLGVSQFIATLRGKLMMDDLQALDDIANQNMDRFTLAIS